MSSTDAPVVDEESYDVKIGRVVHQLMWDRKLTQTAFGPRVGIQQGVLTRKLRGQRGWSADELARVAKELQVPVGRLFGELPEEDSNFQPAGIQPRYAEVIVLRSSTGMPRIQRPEAAA